MLAVLVAVIVTIVQGPILGLPYPLALGVLVGVLEVLTFIGPIVAGVNVAIAGLATGGLPMAAAAVIFLFVLRQNRGRGDHAQPAQPGGQPAPRR